MTEPCFDVFEFHMKFGCYAADEPGIPPLGVKELGRKLLVEEFEETLRAIDSDNLPEIADGIADLIYVAIGMAIRYGIYLPEVWDEVHASNMRKEGGATRGDGKILKPEGWRGPDVAGILQEQGWKEAA